jgi:hypothetical protein
VISLGLAFPCVFFITCHTKKPIVLVLPHLYCSTIAGFSATTVLQILINSSFERAGASNHFSLIISDADAHEANISSITNFI